MSNKNPLTQDNSQLVTSNIKENESKLIKQNKKQVNQLTEEEKQKQTEEFQKFLTQTGLSDAFQIIFAEIIQKKMKEEDSYKYTADRLREIGKGLNAELMKVKTEIQRKELQEKLKRK